MVNYGIKMNPLEWIDKWMLSFQTFPFIKDILILDIKEPIFDAGRMMALCIETLYCHFAIFFFVRLNIHHEAQ